MLQQVVQQKWKSVEYSRSQIINTVRIIRQDNSSEEEIRFATDVINNWRAAHALLTV